MIREAGSPDRLPHIEVWKRRNRTFGCFRLFACLPECRSLGDAVEKVGLAVAVRL